MATYPHPQYANELIEEQLQVQKEFRDEQSTENVSKMSILNSFIRETMRFHLMGMSAILYTTADWTLSNGYAIKKGTLIELETFFHVYDNEFPEGSLYEFIPFRHTNNGKSAIIIGPDSLIWGVGRHACPGGFLEIQEIMTMTSFILRNYKISTIDGSPHPYMVKPIPFEFPEGRH